MASSLNGMAAHGGVRPFGSTFLIFFDYLKPSLRLAALSRLPVILVGTHDSIGLGEDGPTHQPIEQLAMLRAIPNVVVLRPADATETVEAWKVAIERRDGPTALVLTRQKLPIIDRSGCPPASAPAARRLHSVRSAGRARGRLSRHRARRYTWRWKRRAAPGRRRAGPGGLACHRGSCSRPSLQGYRDEVLPPAITVRVAIEAASPWAGTAGSAPGAR